MGVAGAGKTAVGECLAARLGWSFHDGDDLHPEANVRKMAAGEPLSDEDRRPFDVDAPLEAVVDRVVAFLGPARNPG